MWVRYTPWKVLNIVKLINKLMKTSTKDNLYYLVVLLSIIGFFILGLLDIIPIYVLNNIYIVYLVLILGGLILVIWNYKNQSNLFFKREVEIIENLFATFLAITILSLLFFRFNGKVHYLYGGTFFLLFFYIYSKINQYKRKERLNPKELLINFLWGFSPAFFGGSLIYLMQQDQLEGLSLGLLFFLNVILLYLLIKFKKK